MSIEISLEGLQTLSPPEDRALAHLKISYNNNVYNWSLYIPPNTDLGSYIESNKTKIQADIDAKEAAWAALDPKTRTLTNPLTQATETVDIAKEEIVRPDIPDYYALRRAAYPSLAEQLGALWKGPDSADYQNMMSQIQAVKDQFPKQ